MSSTPKYVATLSRVREVSLLGTAELAFWKEQLSEADLAPAEFDGKARILILAADLKFMGLRFQELSVCVVLPPPREGGWQDAAYLVRAFNSRRLFAFGERAMHSAPYYHGAIRVSASFPLSIEVVAATGEGTFQAAMGQRADAPMRSGLDGWNGPVFLPELPERRKRTSESGHARKLFFAKLHGASRTYPFLSSADTVKITASDRSNVFGLLVDSGFAGLEWVVRLDATHAKSKTYPVNDATASLRAEHAA
jgi:hypothetical protein